MDRDIEFLVDSYEECTLTNKSVAGKSNIVYLDDGPLQGRAIRYGGLPGIIVVSEASKPQYHDYKRMARSNHYCHSKECKCDGG